MPYIGVGVYQSDVSIRVVSNEGIYYIIYMLYWNIICRILSCVHIPVCVISEDIPVWGWIVTISSLTSAFCLSRFSVESNMQRWESFSEVSSCLIEIFGLLSTREALFFVEFDFVIAFYQFWDCGAKIPELWNSLICSEFDCCEGLAWWGRIINSERRVVSAFESKL